MIPSVAGSSHHPVDHGPLHDSGGLFSSGRRVRPAVSCMGVVSMLCTISPRF
ncbi:hypothetical protein LVY72_17645 [Arthrobacter sp. I2-34]|uniref:Uncharacterized protein n=1 Tax=Arthrobacter hankyongi TaxID=2904801 RepID=A0ABS9LAV1_9MICC|nr:hypothetical protein [Arthrobacter hankyongi]MCG2623721.1 hypothetical protein [Arthrobacter hankyongi]